MLFLLIARRVTPLLYVVTLHHSFKSDLTISNHYLTLYTIFTQLESIETLGVQQGRSSLIL